MFPDATLEPGLRCGWIRQPDRWVWRCCAL